MLKLSKMTDYAVIVLSIMAEEKAVENIKNNSNKNIHKKECGLLSASAISKNTNLPIPTVSKILKLLARQNIIDSVRGANGGYRLLIKPEDITIAMVIRATDGPLQLIACIDQDNDCCSHMAKCSMRGKWGGVNAAMTHTLEGISLRQMMGGV